MKLANYLVLLFVITISALCAQNQMDLMLSFEGEFNGSRYGDRVLAMDFNGDGYDDLIVHSTRWNPTGAYAESLWHGKLYFYWGGPAMDTIPDFVMQGSYNGEYGVASPINGGDINGDGIDDLVINYYIDPDPVAAVYYGTANPTGTPDLAIVFPIEIGIYPQVTALGDINGDGHADLLGTTLPMSYLGVKRYIWTGNANPFYLLAETTNDATETNAIGVGDTNADGFDDYVLQYAIPGGTNANNRIVLYYGSDSFPVVDSLVITENSNRVLPYLASPLGDLNNDGFADFNTFCDRVWFGSNQINENHDFVLNIHDQNHDWDGLAYNYGTPFIYGDLNGDGYDDIIGSCYSQGWYDGEAGVWLGGSNMDGLRDLYINQPNGLRTRQFGWSKSAGDFNGDGLCDLAVSAPVFYATTWQIDPGRVYLFSGNAALDDTVVSIDDQVETATSWDLNVYPNPVQRTLNIQLLSSGNISKGECKLQIYNLKGQRVFAQLLPISSFTESSQSVSLPELRSGVYFLRLSQNKNQVNKKICIIN